MNYLLEDMIQNRKKLSPLETIINQRKQHEISDTVFERKVSRFLSKLFKTTIHIQVITTSTPYVFINCDIASLDIQALALVISHGFIEQFTTGEIIAALLHESANYVSLQKQPNIIRYFQKAAHTNSIIRQLLQTIITTGIIIKQKQKANSDKSNNESLPDTLTNNSLVMNLLTIAAFVMAVSVVIQALIYIISIRQTYKIKNISDDVATRLGYGKELASFIQKYGELTDLYGGNDVSDIMHIIKKVILLLGLIRVKPTNNDRICHIAKTIMQECKKHNINNKDMQWAKLAIIKYCKLGSNAITKTDERKLKELFNEIYDKLLK